MLVKLNIARMIVNKAIRQAANGEEIKNIPVVMKAIDKLGDGDGQVEMSDVITAVSDYVSDIGDKIASLAHHCPEVIENAGVSISGLLSSIGDGIGSIPDIASAAAESAGGLFDNAIDGIVDFIGDLFT